MKHALCTTDSITDPGSMEFSVDAGRDTIVLFVVHKDGQFFAYKNSCPHTGATLNWNEHQFLDLDNQFIQCSVHDALFEIDSGVCVAGPCNGQSMTALPLTVSDNQIYVDL